MAYSQSGGAGGSGAAAAAAGHGSRRGRPRRSEAEDETYGDGAGDEGEEGASDGDAASDAGGGDDSDAAPPDDDGNLEFCDLCPEEGSLVCCDRCVRSYHPPCLGLRALPPGVWLCPECVRVFGPHREREGTTDGPLCTAYYDGPFSGHAAKHPGDARAELSAILAELRDHELSAPFCKPVPASLRAYFEVIRQPMDLGRISNRLKAGVYSNAGSSSSSSSSASDGRSGSSGAGSFNAVRMAADLRLVFNNSLTFNRPMSTLWRCAELLYMTLETALRDRLELSPSEASELRRLREAELQPVPIPEIAPPADDLD
jgi:hypothetical protein